MLVNSCSLSYFLYIYGCETHSDCDRVKPRSSGTYFYNVLTAVELYEIKNLLWKQ